MNVLGYFVHRADKEINSWTAMIVIEEEVGKELLCYTGQEQHSYIMDRKYLDECVPITKEQYKEASKLFYTPPEYL